MNDEWFATGSCKLVLVIKNDNPWGRPSGLNKSSGSLEGT